MYETQNKKIIGHLAKSELKSRKMGNFFIMITIVIAACLLMVTGVYPKSEKLAMQRGLAQAQDVTYMEVGGKQIENLKKDERIAYLTCMKQGERIELEDCILSHVYFDGRSTAIKAVDLAEGKLPQKKNEVAVSKEYMKKIGKEARLRAKLQVPLLSGGTETYVVSGFINDEAGGNVYRILHSLAYAEKGQTLKGVSYDALAKIRGATAMTKETFLTQVRDIGKEAGIPRSQINENDHFLSTLSESGFSKDMLAIVIVSLILLVAGVMVIYSIFYISVSGKTRQYGQLRTLGMTKKQVCRLVRREGLLLTLRALPAGLVLGGVIAYLVSPGGFFLPNVLIMAAIAALVILVTVQISVRKPARMAAAVPPIEAANYSAYQGQVGRKATRKLKRKITPLTLAKMNSLRNRKKTFVTMLSLGIGGVLLIGAVTFAVSLDKDKFARQGEFERGEFVVGISQNAIETAEHGTMEIKLKKPFTDSLRQEIGAISGVKRIYGYSRAEITYDYGDQSKRNDVVTPFAKTDLSNMEKERKAGSLDQEELLSGNKIVIRGNDQVEEIFGWRFAVGDTVRIHYWDGKKEKTKIYEIAADVGNYAAGATDGWFLLPKEELSAQLPEIDLTNNWVISTDPKATDQVEEELEQILEKAPELRLASLRATRVQSDKIADQFISIIIGLVLFVVLFSMINLINTLVTSFMSQKTELAMFQSVGMTGKQISCLVMGEGLLLAVGNIVISLIFGSLLGYGVCQLFDWIGIHYMNYRFPLVWSLLYIAVVVLVPCVISLVLIHRFKGQSLVDRLREI